MKRLVMAVQCLVALGVAGCAGTYYDPYYYDYTYYDPYYYYYDSYYAYTWVDPFYDYYYFSVTPATPGTPVDLNDAAQRIAGAAGTYYTPAGCASSTASGAIVTTTFNSCDGPRGKVSGTTELKLAQTQTTLAFSSTSQNLMIDGEPFNMDLTGTIVSSGSQRVLKLVSKSFSPQRLDSRQAESTVTWEKGTRCLNIVGTSTASHGGQSASATLNNFNRCVGQCPSSGQFTVQSPNGAFTGTFDGSNRFQVMAPDGTSKGYDLTCG